MHRTSVEAMQFQQDTPWPGQWHQPCLSTQTCSKADSLYLL